MPLTAQQRNRIRRQFVREAFVRLNLTAVLAGPDIDAAADALEAFIVGNAAAINNALPEPFKTNATLAQKRGLVALVACEIAGFIDLGGD